MGPPSEVGVEKRSEIWVGHYSRPRLCLGEPYREEHVRYARGRTFVDRQKSVEQCWLKHQGVALPRGRQDRRERATLGAVEAVKAS